MDRFVSKADVRPPLQYIVRGMCADNISVAWLRLAAFAAYCVVGFAPIYGGFAGFSLHSLRYVLMLHHTAAALGVDEGLLLNVPAKVGLARRLLTPGTRVTPLWHPNSVLPKRNWMCWMFYWPFVYVAGSAAYRGLGVPHQLPVAGSTDDETLRIYLALFFCASACDVGLFYSTRPGDILKFLVALYVLPAEASAWVCFVMLCLLYTMSGLAKVGGWFDGWVLPYWFLALAPISYQLKPLYLDRDLAPRRWLRLFGKASSVGEVAIGAALLATAPFSFSVLSDPGAARSSADAFTSVAPMQEAGPIFYALCLATSMHAFICSFGIGPYRWNVMTAYLLWCSTALLPTQLPTAEILTTQALPLAFVAVFGLAIPAVGFASTEFLGRYLGGYRMANFHFAGNEHAVLLLLPKSRLRPEVAAIISAETELAGFPIGADGVDARPLLARKYEQTHTPMLLRTLITTAPMLNSKQDESIVSIRAAYCEYVAEELLTALPAELKGGAAAPKQQQLLLLTCYPTAFLGMHAGQRTKRWDVATFEESGGGSRVLSAGEVALPWEQGFKLLKE